MTYTCAQCHPNEPHPDVDYCHRDRKPVVRYSFEYTGFDGHFCVVIKYWRLSIKQALAKFKYTHRFHTMSNLAVYTQDN